LYVDTLREYGEHYLLADSVTLKAGGHFETDSMFLVKKGACAVVEDIALHLERKFGHAPKSLNYAFVEVWK